MDFNAAAENDKFVKFTDLLHPWMQAYVNPFLESLIGEGKVTRRRRSAPRWSRPSANCPKPS